MTNSIYAVLRSSPKNADGNSEYDRVEVEKFYKELYFDLSVDPEENTDLKAFFEENTPPAGDLVSMRATAFKAAVDSLTEDREANVSLLRCVNVAVHAFETTCLV